MNVARTIYTALLALALVVGVTHPGAPTATVVVMTTALAMRLLPVAWAMTHRRPATSPAS